MQREEAIKNLQSNPPDVLVVGAGINGSGTFRDLALNGVNVLLIDRADFCSGASAASSHMAHGGIRYLENGEFRLVREAVQERNRMIENAPHMVRPLQTTIPIFRIFSGLLNAPLKFLGWLDKPSERGALVIKIGLMAYDAFTRNQKTVPVHQFLVRRKALQKFPGMNEKILFTATYYDGSILSPERLALEIVLDGEAEGDHASALNYISLQEINDGVIKLRDELTERIIEVQPKFLINAAGPWIDQANDRLGLPTQYIGGTKGSHLMLDNQELHNAIGSHEIFFENEDGRIVLIFPLLDKVLVGTSDLFISNVDEARCTPEEVDYFIDMLERVFPDILVERSQVVFQFSGVRPLPFTQAKNTWEISRDHSILDDQIGHLPVLSLVGGKWTSYRAFSEQVTDRVLDYLDMHRKASTCKLPIAGGKEYPGNERSKKKWSDAFEKETGILRDRVEQLFYRYGTRSKQVAKYLLTGKDSPLKCWSNFTTREIQWLVKNEKIIHLDDLLIRRTLLAYLGELSLPLVKELAEVVGSVLDWDATTIQSEVNRSLEILQDKHGVSFIA